MSSEEERPYSEEDAKERSAEDSYWVTLYQVMEYAVDAAECQQIYVGDSQACQLREADFLRSLYVQRAQEDYETQIITQMTQSAPVVCVAGERGCGKTSTLRFCIQYLKRHHPELRVVTLNMKALYDARHFDRISQDNASAVFRQVTRDQVLMDLFPSSGTANALLAWTLAGPPDEGDHFPQSLAADFHSLSLDALDDAGCSELTSRSARRRALESWLASHPKAKRRYRRRMRSLLRTAHIVRAFVATTDASKVVLVLDNVDRIPSELQPEFLVTCNDGQLSVQDACTTVIAIRTENMRGDEPRPGQYGDLITVILPDDEEYPAILLPRIGRRYVAQVLSRRQQFTKDLFSRSKVESASGPSAPHGPQVDPFASVEFRALDPIHQSVLREFSDNAVHNLSNGSMRITLSLYAGFVRYLAKLISRNLLDMKYLSRADPERHLHTLFFLWLRSKGDVHGVAMFDILQLSASEGSRAHFAQIVSPEHLLLTCIWNLISEKTAPDNQPSYPTWAVIVDRMTMLGFEYPRIREALGSFMSVPGEQPRAIDVFRRSIKPEQLQSDSSVRVRLTPMGRELVTRIQHKVGYMWGSAVEDPERPIKERSYFALSRHERMLQLHAFLRRLGVRHLEALATLRREWYPRYREEWLGHYVGRFAVEDRMQVERMLESAGKFFGRDFPNEESSPFWQLYEGYEKCLNEVEKGTPFAEIDESAMPIWEPEGTGKAI